MRSQFTIDVFAEAVTLAARTSPAVVTSVTADLACFFDSGEFPKSVSFRTLDAMWVASCLHIEPGDLPGHTLRLATSIVLLICWNETLVEDPTSVDWQDGAYFRMIESAACQPPEVACMVAALAMEQSRRIPIDINGPRYTAEVPILASVLLLLNTAAREVDAIVSAAKSNGDAGRDTISFALSRLVVKSDVFMNEYSRIINKSMKPTEAVAFITASF